MIDDSIVDLHKALKNTGSDSIFDSVIYRRLLILSFIANISDINSKLKKLSEDLNTSIDIEAKEIDYDLFLKDAYWKDCWILDDYDYSNKDADNGSFDEIASCLPCEGTGHTIMPESIESFKTGLHLLCDSDRMSEHDLKYALHNCFRKMKSLLNEVRDKSKRAEASMYANFWDDIYACYEKEPVLANYNNWKDEIGDLDFAKLKDKQTQELVKVLTSGFLEFRPMPTNGEINSCKLIIDEDALVAGYVLPDNIKELCARFEYFMSWKDKGRNIIVLDYVKLGKYLYEHHGLIWVKSTAILYFDIILDAIQKNMAEIRPQLKSYLKSSRTQQPGEDEDSWQDRARRSKLDEIIQILQKGNWKQPATAENVELLLNTIFGKEQTLLEEDKIECDKMWRLVESGSGASRQEIISGNLAGFFRHENLLAGSPKRICIDIFGIYDKNLTNYINKGNPNNCSLAFEAVIPFLRKYIDKIIRKE